VDANRVIKNDLGGRHTLYSIKPTPIEPDYSVILRNLPRETNQLPEKDQHGIRKENFTG
jgi:hypothetical protein